MSYLATFGIVLACMFFWLAAHPFTTYPLSLWVLRHVGGRKRFTPDVNARPQTFSIVFCAYNEESVLPAKLENMKEIRRRFGSDKIRVLAYNDCSADRTLEILRSAEPDVEVFTGTARGGKSIGMNRLLEQVTSDVVIFTDANVILSPEIIPAFTDAFSDPAVGVACGHLIYGNANTPTASVGTSYWRLEETIKSLETETGSAMGADGSLFAIRRKLFRPVPADIIDDFFTSMSILCDGHRIIRRSDAQAFEASADSSSDEFKRKVRIACRVFNCYGLLYPRICQLSLLNRYKFYSHKWLRWFISVWLLAAFASLSIGIGGLWGWPAGLGCSLAIAACFAVTWLARKAHVPILGKIWEVWLAFWGTWHGVLQSMRGQRFQTWDPVASARKTVVKQAP